MYITALNSTDTSPLDAEGWNLPETTTEFYEETTEYFDVTEEYFDVSKEYFDVTKEYFEVTTGNYDQRTSFYENFNEETPYDFTSVDFHPLRMVALVFSITALLYGVVTYIVFPKARNFQNYVNLNALTSLTLCYVTSNVVNVMLPFFGGCNFYFSFNCWLLVDSVLIYRNIVVVFNTTIRWKYLVSSVFAWGLPIIALVCHSSVVYTTVSFLLVLVNVYLYGRVLYCLCKGTGVREPSRKCRNIQIATTTFFLGGSPMTLFHAVYRCILLCALYEYKNIKIILGYIAFTLSFVYFLLYVMLRTNWRLWYDALAKASVNR